MLLSFPVEVALATDELLGYVAAGLVLGTFLMRSIRALRVMAILSNVAFIGYAGLLGSVPILLLHAILLPLNAWRLSELCGSGGSADQRTAIFDRSRASQARSQLAHEHNRPKAAIESGRRLRRHAFMRRRRSCDPWCRFGHRAPPG